MKSFGLLILIPKSIFNYLVTLLQMEIKPTGNSKDVFFISASETFSKKISHLLDFQCLFYIPLLCSHFLSSPCPHQYKDIYLIYFMGVIGPRHSFLSIVVSVLQRKENCKKLQHLDSLVADVVNIN